MKGNTPFIGVLETYVEGITNLFKPKAKRNKNEQPGNIIKYKAYNMLVEENYGLNINAFGEAQLIDHTFEYDEELGYGVGTLTFDKEVTTIIGDNGIVTWDHNSNILEIILPNTITTIENIGNIAGTVNIPKYLEVMGKAAFYSCRGMTNVVIPKTVRQIGESPFRGHNS